MTITATLGPTNTGKTHRAVEQMLSHRTGIIGLPLRLLAREVYDRITARLGEREVALVTGEEKRVPDKPRYWVCTVESMPTELDVDFVCVDEIQLAADRQRGHTFTERLLHARGIEETWFLGSDQMRPIVQELLPTATVRRHPRFSRLSYIGALGLGALPPRTAVVAFSVADVYELAERLRQRHGGTAVVLGALSPRTRNAQVAMYEAGEVQHMVATDAIGMGLNLDLDRVVFASVHKYDGKEIRPLQTAELAQIAGRAGRFTRDGGFGTLRPLPGLAPRQVEAIERHTFRTLKSVVWRNADLDFSSVGALIDALRERPRRAVLEMIEQADDFEALLQLSRSDVVRARARSEEAVRLLWDVCRIPDFRKLLLDSHIQLLARIYEQLSRPPGRLDEDWMARRVGRLDDTSGDIDALMNRLAFIRTWTYISHQEDWVPRAAHWQEQARTIEDRVSDALHERLTERFVHTVKRVPVAPGHPFGALAELVEEPDVDDPTDRIVAAEHGDLSIDDNGRIEFERRAIARWTRGADMLRPDVVVEQALGPGAQARIQRRLVAWTRDVVADLLPPLSLDGAARGVLYQLRQGLGTVDRRAARDQLEALSDAERAQLEGVGIVLGHCAVYLPSTLRPGAQRIRLCLWSAYYGPPPQTLRPRPATVSLPVDEDIDPAYYSSIGFVVRGSRAIRADQLERVMGELQALAAKGDPFDLPDGVPGWLGARRRDAAKVVRALGYRRVDGNRYTAKPARRRRSSRRRPSS